MNRNIFFYVTKVYIFACMNNAATIRNRIITQIDSGIGFHIIQWWYHGHRYECRHYDLKAINRISWTDEVHPRVMIGGYTLRGAYLALWDEFLTAKKNGKAVEI